MNSTMHGSGPWRLAEKSVLPHGLAMAPWYLAGTLSPDAPRGAL